MFLSSSYDMINLIQLFIVNLNNLEVLSQPRRLGFSSSLFLSCPAARRSTLSSDGSRGLSPWLAFWFDGWVRWRRLSIDLAGDTWVWDGGGSSSMTSFRCAWSFGLAGSEARFGVVR